MGSGPSKGRHGFRRWHERQLALSYAWLTTCLLCGVLVATILEFVGLKGPGITPYVTLVALYFIGLLGFTAWQQFWARLSRAQRFANLATCTRCNAYGLFDVMDDTEQINAVCRACGHRWVIE